MGRGTKAASPATIWMVFTFVFLVIILALLGVLLFLVFNNPDLQWTIGNKDSKAEENRLSQACDCLVTDPTTYVKPTTDLPQNDYNVTIPNPTNDTNNIAIISRDNSAFSELSESEMLNILDFLMSDAKLELVHADEAKIRDNYVYMMELMLPPKEQMLNYLEGKGEKPERQAKVVIMEGNHPRVKEIIVSALPNPLQWIQHKIIDWKVRPRLAPAEVRAMDLFLKEQTRPIAARLITMFGYPFHNCTTNCLQWSFTMPPVPTGKDRNTWIVLRQPHPAAALHAMPLYFLVSDLSTNIFEWKIVNIVYGSARLVYTSIEEFGRDRELPLNEQGLPYTLSMLEDERSSMNIGNTTKYKSQSSSLEHNSTFVNKRYEIDGQNIKYYQWELDFRHRISNGLQLFNVKFNGTRILYELSIQGIVSYYSGYGPFTMHSQYLENFEPLGHTTNNLVAGLDCPEHADFFGGYFYSAKAAAVIARPRHICVFEHDIGVPLKRHRNGIFGGPHKEYGGLPGKSLIIRSIQTFRDTDFIFDYQLYNNGALEAKFYTTGYVLGTFWSSAFTYEDKYGYPIGEYQISPVAQHLVNYKVDLDIQGSSNRHKVVSIDQSSARNDYFRGETINQRKLRETFIYDEADSTYEYDFEEPKILLFYNHTVKNRYGTHKAYRVILNGISKNLLPKDWKWENGIAWARHQMAVTKRKETEDQSFSMYDALDPYRPLVSLQKFISDNEELYDQDLVAWVTVGDYRIPTTNDVPLASTLDLQAGFKLVPFNYFEEDPSKDHPDWVYHQESS